jgi:hypothetical protein
VSESLFKNNENNIECFNTKNRRAKQKFEFLENIESKGIFNNKKNGFSSPDKISLELHIDELEYECINCGQFHKFDKMQYKNHISVCNQNIKKTLESFR